MADIRVLDPLRDTIRPENYVPILRAWRDRPTLWADLMRLPQMPALATSFSGRVMVANALQPFVPLLHAIARRRADGAPALDHPNPTGLPSDAFRAWVDDAVAASLAIRAHRPFFNELRARTGWKGMAPDARLFDSLVACLEEVMPHVAPRAMAAIVEAELFGNEVRMAAERAVFHGANIVKFFAAAAKANPDEEYDVEVDVAAPYAMQIAVYCVTMGHDCEDRARAAGEKKEAFRALLLDAIGSSVADTIALDLTQLVEREHWLRGPDGAVARKLSVGYGDWPLEEQRVIFAILDPTKHIGVALNDACLMVPEKSVSGLIGMKRKS
ncbi:MAG TPA: vitamin B12 dependent-methionine synthase activation domain-containing protein [Planctomycetota bacterium]|nr:vitamin B12 dependent-methionine synthase activation domain-containing protein [Planctomycetota bacterium]